MARNAEKAMTALSRWRALKEEEEKGPEKKRPNDPAECRSLQDADNYRRQLIREIAKKITMIQNPGLGEYKIRDLNDDINKSLRSKLRWEDRIKQLGGPDWRKIAPKMLDREGREIPGAWGYKYFGAARDLPGVRELFEPVPVDKSKKTRAELMKDIDADYYGYMDDDDGLLLPLEAEAEAKAIDKCVAEWRAKKANDADNAELLEEDADDMDIYKIADEDDENVEMPPELAEKIAAGGSVQFDERNEPTRIEQPIVPSQQDIETAIIRRKKMELLNKYAGDSLGSELSAILSGTFTIEQEKQAAETME